MFIILPLIFIAGSAVGVFVIIRRKMPYLKKLTPENNEIGESVLHDFFPELMAWIGQIDLAEIKQHALRELEKFLRKLRVATLKVDHISDSLIKNIRRAHLNNHIEHVIADEKAAEPAPKTEPAKDPKTVMMEDLKTQEQKLIIEIAQNPKDPKLFEVLGDLYLKLENLQDARDAYEAALGLNPNDQGIARKYSRLLKKPEAVV